MSWLTLPSRIALSAIVLLGAVTPLAAGSNDPFAGIDDPKVLPLLKHLPYEHGGMNVPKQDGRLLYDLIIERGYKRGLEIGTSNGYSTLWLGLAFRKAGGKVITIEYEAKRAAEARRNFAEAGLLDVIDARVADAFKEIPKIEGEFDFVFLDAWKPDYIAFWKLVKDRLVPGGAFTAHNVTGHENHMREFLEAIRSDPAFETTIHELSRAGVSVSVKRK
jgi:predicted O-methyltransferase YrrM